MVYQSLGGKAMHPADIPWPSLWRFHHYGSGDLEDASLIWETPESPIVPNQDQTEDEEESLHSSVPRGSLRCDQRVVTNYYAKTTLPSKMASLSLVSMPWWQLAPQGVKSTKITPPKSQNIVTTALPILWPWFLFLQR